MLKKLKYPGHIFFSRGCSNGSQENSCDTKSSYPRTVKKVKSFLGMTNFYRRVISHYADKAHGLTK